jgi:hypothetical protein
MKALAVLFTSGVLAAEARRLGYLAHVIDHIADEDDALLALAAAVHLNAGRVKARAKAASARRRMGAVRSTRLRCAGSVLQRSRRLPTSGARCFSATFPPVAMDDIAANRASSGSLDSTVERRGPGRAAPRSNSWRSFGSWPRWAVAVVSPPRQLSSDKWSMGHASVEVSGHWTCRRARQVQTRRDRRRPHPLSIRAIQPYHDLPLSRSRAVWVFTKKPCFATSRFANAGVITFVANNSSLIAEHLIEWGFDLDNARAKLRVGTPAEAALKAAMDRLIEP